MNDTANDHLRRERRRNKLGPDAACVVCGETDARVLESHHIAGRRNDHATMAVLCRNHHAAITDDLRTDGVPMTEPGSPFARLAAILGGLATLFRRLADTLAGWSEWLSRLDAAADDHLRALASSLPAPELLS